MELENALEKTDIDILGLSEIRRVDENIIIRKSGYMLYYYGAKQGVNGVGFLVKANLKGKIQYFKAISDRIVMLRMNFGSRRIINLIQVYAPTSASSQEEIEHFYNKLEETVAEAKRKLHSKLIIIGDFNSIVGSGQKEERQTMGPYGIGKRNERGWVMLRFCQQQRLRIVNSYFKRRSGRRWTWQSPDGKYKNEIDFILTSNKSIISGYEVLTNFEFHSDHRPVVCKLNITKSIPTPRKNLVDIQRNVDEENIKLQLSKYLHTCT